MHLCKELAGRVRHAALDSDGEAEERALDRLEKPRQTLAKLRRGHHRVRRRHALVDAHPLRAIKRQAVQRVRLVEDKDLRRSLGLELLDDALHRPHLLACERRRRVDHMQDERRLLELLERRPKGRDEFGGQLLDEAHRVGEEHLLPTGQPHAARRRIERREVQVVGVHLGRAAQRVQQRRLAGVRVPDYRDQGEVVALAPLRSVELALRAHLVHLRLEALQLLAEETLVRLELRLARALEPAAAAAGAAALRVHPRARGHEGLKPRQHVPHLRRLHLQLGLARPRALRENLQDEHRPVKNLDLAAECVLQVAALRRR